LGGWIDGFVDKCSRITSTGRFIPELDGLRAVAIGVVFLQHLRQVLLAQARPDAGAVIFGVRRMSDATMGVELFFVISGFILALPFASYYAAAGPAVRLRAYYLRRLTRLEPPYVLHLLLVAIVLLSAGRRVAEVGPHFASSLFYVSNIVYGQFHLLALNNVTWSLEIEVQFYLLAPLLAQVFRVRRRFRAIVIVLATLVAVGVRQGLEWRYGRLPLTLLTYAPYFAVGFLIADQYVSDWHERSPRRAVADVAAVMAWVLVVCVFQLQRPHMGLIAAGGFYVAVSASLQSDLIKRMLANRVVRTLGGMCYSIYLLHWLLLNWLVPLVHLPVSGDSIPGMTVAVVVFGLPIIGISAVYFVFVEKPCMRRDWWRPMATRGARAMNR
jgi:peptidoglycan/LPS O-acetylase OafA/YrhL